MSKIVDERVVSIKRRIQSNAYLMYQVALVVAILIQQFFYQAPLSQYLGEVICLLLVSSYVALANVREGIYRDRKNEDIKKERLKIAVALFAALGAQYFVVGEHNPLRLATFSISFLVFSMLMRAILTSSSERRQEQIDEELSREESAEDME